MNHRDAETQRDTLTENVIGAAIEVHRHLGPRLLESAYEECLCHELKLRGLSFARQVSLPVKYKGVQLDCGYRMDMVIENSLVVELKAVRSIEPVHEAQLFTYMRLAEVNRGLILNFYVPVLKHGIKRMIL